MFHKDNRHAVNFSPDISHATNIFEQVISSFDCKTVEDKQLLGCNLSIYIWTKSFYQEAYMYLLHVCELARLKRIIKT